MKVLEEKLHKALEDVKALEDYQGVMLEEAKESSYISVLKARLRIL
jgi:hypothetical protein